ncbi:MAG TPA: (2Fe-2S) ferredoxin domain-containing protein [bacterium]|nr:(2Fe-2S) ferredoxin domain-containing protein [bacterium]
METEILYLCMGSACHHKGVYDVLPKLKQLLIDNNQQIKVELKGSFCLGPCIDGIVLKYRDILFKNVNINNIETKFYDEILPFILNSQTKK